MHEYALLVPGPGGLGPLMTMRLRLLGYSRSGHQSHTQIRFAARFTRLKPICLRVDDAARFVGVAGHTNRKLATNRKLDTKFYRNSNETAVLKWPANGRFEKFISTCLANDKSGSSLTSTDFDIT